jgi:hypothetical protein
MRLAKGDLFTILDLLRDLEKLTGREHLPAEREEMVFFLVQMGEKHVHHIVETTAPVWVYAVFPKPDGEAFQGEHHGRMVIAQLVDQTAVRDAFAVIQDAKVDVLIFEMFLDRRLEALQSGPELLRITSDHAFQGFRFRPQRLVIGD